MNLHFDPAVEHPEIASRIEAAESDTDEASDDEAVPPEETSEPATPDDE